MNDIDLEIKTLAAISSGKIVCSFLHNETKDLEKEIGKKQEEINNFNDKISRMRGSINEQKVSEAAEMSINRANKRKNHKIKLWKKEEIFSIIECIAFNIMMILVLLRVVYHDYGTLSPAGNTEIKWVYIICSIAMAGFTAIIWIVRNKISWKYGEFGSIREEKAEPTRDAAFTVDGMEKNLNQLIQKKKEFEEKTNKDIEAYNERIKIKKKQIDAYFTYLANKYSAILPTEDFNDASLLLYYIQSKRADSIKDALRLYDDRKNNKEQFNEELKVAASKLKEYKEIVKPIGLETIKEFSSISDTISDTEAQALANKWSQYWAK